MTYFGFLALFLGVPIAMLLVVALWDRSRGRDLPAEMRALSPAAAIALHAVIALLYTTIWDNYLVATRVWWYDPARVTGVTIGYVPIEEYTFFVVQPIMAGLWLVFLLRRLKLPAGQALDPAFGWPAWRWWVLILSAVIWIGSAVLLASGWQPGIYLGLELIWAVPPIALQLLFGADILWRYRRVVALALISMTVYLSVADAIAINIGIWSISPQKSLGLLLGGILPVEELMFFLLTNTLVTFGITLVLAQTSHERFKQIRNWLQRREMGTANS